MVATDHAAASTGPSAAGNDVAERTHQSKPIKPTPMPSAPMTRPAGRASSACSRGVGDYSLKWMKNKFCTIKDNYYAKRISQPIWQTYAILSLYMTDID